MNSSKTEVLNCDQCHYVAKRKLHLSRHIKTMHGGNVEDKSNSKDKRMCPHCFKLFCNSTKVRRHIKNMHTTEKFNCEICQEKCSSSNALKKHSESHLAQRRLPVRKCYYCEKKVTKKNMWRHIEEVHDKTRSNTDKIDVTSYPYDCEQCSFSSKRKFDLKRHVMVKHSL